MSVEVGRDAMTPHSERASVASHLLANRLDGDLELLSNKSREPSEHDFGVDMDLAIGFELDGFAGFGAASDLPGEMTIFATSWPLFSTCMPVASGLPLSSIPSVTSSASGGSSSHGYWW